MHPAIDAHSHMLCREWVELLKAHGAPRFAVKTVSGTDVIHHDGVPFMTPQPQMFDYEYRLKAMDVAGVATAILSLTGPNVYWGGEEISARAARVMNDSFAEAQARYPGRIRWIASLPFEYPARALTELDRVLDKGAVGIVVLSNVAGKPLTDPSFEPVWREIDRRSLPVFMHPTVPCGCGFMGIERYQLTAAVAFPFDTTLAVSRMIFDGFFDRYPRLKLILSHGGGALPFLASRLEHCFERIRECRETAARSPGFYIDRLYADTIVYSDRDLQRTLETFGENRVLYGTDFPHGIGDMPGILERIDRLAPAARNKLRGANALRVFNLGAADDAEERPLYSQANTNE